ncbi:ParB/RepB/Spo0J family partition protein [Breznakiellaceae bacterium SP9]
MSIKHGLGKGISALFPGTEDASPHTEEIIEDRSPPPSAEAGAELFIPLDKLRVNPSQPRRSFDEDALGELAASIAQQGVIQPIIAEDVGDGTYIIIAGERRARASRIAGLSEIPVILRKYSDEKRLEVSLIENIQRQDLNPIEEAAAYRALMELGSLSQEEVAVKVGKNRSTVANALRLLKLPPLMQESIVKGTLSSGHARALLSVTESQKQELLYREILQRGITVRETEKRAAALNAQTLSPAKAQPNNDILTEAAAADIDRSTLEPEAAKPQTPDAEGTLASSVDSRPVFKREPELTAIEEQLIRRLGTKVVIDGSTAKGAIRIDYYSMDDLDRLLEIINAQ